MQDRPVTTMGRDIPVEIMKRDMDADIMMQRKITVADAVPMKEQRAEKAVDVAVENSLYGELRGNLNLASRYDVDNFIQQAKNTPESLLSRMTGGVHLHTLHCPDADSFERIRQALDEKGILYRKE